MNIIACIEDVAPGFNYVGVTRNTGTWLLASLDENIRVLNEDAHVRSVLKTMVEQWQLAHPDRLAHGFCFQREINGTVALMPIKEYVV